MNSKDSTRVLDKQIYCATAPLRHSELKSPFNEGRLGLYTFKNDWEKYFVLGKV